MILQIDKIDTLKITYQNYKCNSFEKLKEENIHWYHINLFDGFRHGITQAISFLNVFYKYLYSYDDSFMSTLFWTI